jgi:hypothetical protein
MEHAGDLNMCACEFDTDPEEPEDTWHFRRTCEACGTVWYGLHCPHDGYQNPCPGCGLRPAVVPDSDT